MNSSYLLRIQASGHGFGLQRVGSPEGGAVKCDGGAVIELEAWRAARSPRGGQGQGA